MRMIYPDNVYGILDITKKTVYFRCQPTCIFFYPRSAAPKSSRNSSVVQQCYDVTSLLLYQNSFEFRHLVSASIYVTSYFLTIHRCDTVWFSSEGRVRSRFLNFRLWFCICWALATFIVAEVRLCHLIGCHSWPMENCLVIRVVITVQVVVLSYAFLFYTFLHYPALTSWFTLLVIKIFWLCQTRRLHSTFRD